jgi:predicted TIM-barrel enzyme
MLLARGISGGCSSLGEFCPSAFVTREQMAAFIIRYLFGELFPYPLTPYFADVPQTNPFFKYVQKMKELGITDGCSTTPAMYCSKDTVTRRAMSKFLIRASMGDAFPYRATRPYFADVTAADPFFKYVQKLKDMGVTSGCSATQYCADDPPTREQMAAFLVRTFVLGF